MENSKSISALNAPLNWTPITINTYKYINNNEIIILGLIFYDECPSRH